MPDLTQVKFKENGDFNQFRGNTVVANLFHDEKLMKIVAVIHSHFSQLPFIDKFTLTPPGSIHMTVMELLCDQNRLPEFWSKDIPIDLPIEAVSNYFGEQLDTFPLLDEEIVMKVTSMGNQNILLAPADTQSAERLKEIRNNVSQKTGVQFPDHEQYQFHISVGYLREELTDEEVLILDDMKEELNQILFDQLPTITINQIDYTLFDDMTKFVPYSPK